MTLKNYQGPQAKSFRLYEFYYSVFLILEIGKILKHAFINSLKKKDNTLITC